MGIIERKEREKEQRRQDIVTAAEKVFFTKGFEKATVDEIAKEAEYSKGTVYLYFKSKEDIQFGVLQRGAEVLLEMLSQVVSDEKKGIENLVEMAGAFISYSKQYQDYFKLFLFFQNNDMSGLDMTQEELRDYFLNQCPFALLNKIVKKGINDGSLRNDIPSDLLATTLWSQMMGLLVILENKRDLHNICGIEQTAIVATHFELIINGAAGSDKS